MNFKQRLLRYLIGFGIGIMISLFFFGDKLHLFTSWLPSNVVKSRLVDSYWDVSPRSTCLLACIEMDVPEFKSQIVSGEVDFKGSLTEGEQKEYELVFPESDLLRSARFAVKDSSARILDIRAVKNCDCP